MLADLLGDNGGICAFMADIDDVFTEHTGLFAIAGIRHFFDACLFPACAVFKTRKSVGIRRLPNSCRL